MTKVCAVVLNWKQSQTTIQTIQSLLSSQTNNLSLHIVLVDNNSPDGSYSLFKNKFSTNKHLTLIRNSTNYGYAQGNNIGLKIALKRKPDYILVANNDIIFDPLFLKYLVDKIKSDPQIAIVSPKIYFAPGFEYHRHRYQKKDLGNVIWAVGGKIDWDNIIGTNIGIDEIDKGQYDLPLAQPDYLSGCCLLIRPYILKKVGFFDPAYFMYLEDVDFCYRVIRLGYFIAVEPKSKIWHLNSGSSSVGSHLHDYFLTRNRLLFGFRYARPKTKIALIRESLRLLFFSPSAWQKSGVLDFYIQRLGKGSWQ